MLKKLVFSVSLLAVASGVAQAQATDPYPSTAPGACLLSPSIFVSYTPTKCYGFFNQNLGVLGFATGQSVSSTNNTTAWNALINFGYSSSGTYSVIEKIDDGDGTLNFNTMLTGWTVIGLHWGNYPNSLQGATNIGNVSAFYLVNITPGTKNLVLADNQGISNASIISTGGTCTAQGCTPGISTVPEPSTYALMAAGLLGVVGVTRRRRNAQG